MQRRHFFRPSCFVFRRGVRDCTSQSKTPTTNKHQATCRSSSRPSQARPSPSTIGSTRLCTQVPRPSPMLLEGPLFGSGRCVYAKLYCKPQVEQSGIDVGACAACATQQRSAPLATQRQERAALLLRHRSSGHMKTPCSPPCPRGTSAHPAASGARTARRAPLCRRSGPPTRL